ncbi:sensor domain-containing diguanylate cyclase [Phytopseudomonas dryadis]|uniref:diguanylate cyclase n=1 Tax=Phytopseudomonas dryadis TaxID=2487520 RepID=A0ABY1Z5N1_9GAMM|nr:MULTISPECIES: sensor domain-containing diguanylate cyclase [Pseudomonas]TBV05381.1 diguanylate cyclase [Pseudomonas dryadis]TBV18391.1 diguanylate cyclase [Pseudomonas sp. FRB 230]
MSNIVFTHRIHRAILHTVIISACLILIGVEVLSICAQRQARLHQAEVNVLNLSVSLAQHASDSLKIADATLGPLAEAMARPVQPNQQSLHEILVSQVARSDRVHGVFVYDAEGNWVNSSLAQQTGSHNNADREYFMHHKENTTALPFIGRPVRSRSDDSDIITISHRYNQPDGKFGGVVLASIKSDYFRSFYRTLDVEDNGKIDLIREDGIILAGVHGHDGSDEMAVPNREAFDAIKHLGKGNFIHRDDSEQTVRIAAFSSVPEFPLFVFAGVDRREVLSGWWLATLSGVVGTVVCISLLIAAAIWLDRQLVATQRREIHFRRESEVDGLTGIANRRIFDSHLAARLTESSSFPISLSLLLIDVDHFKQFNDRYGHAGGDDCLRQIAHALQSVQRRTNDLVARYGGEEFAILLPDCDLHQAHTMAEEVNSKIRNLAIQHDSSPHGIVTVSIGVASTVIANEITPRALIEQADTALYRAKENGRDTVCS